MYSNKKIRVGDVIIYKPNDKLTDQEYRDLFPPKHFPDGYHGPLVVLHKEVIGIPVNEARVPVSASASPARASEEVLKRRKPLGMPKEPPSDHQVYILDRMQNGKKHIVIKALAGCGKTNTLQRVAWTLKQTRIKLKDKNGNCVLDKNGKIKMVSLMDGRKVHYLAYNKRLKIEVDPKMFGTGVKCQTTHAFFLGVLGLTPDNIEEGLDNHWFLAVLCNRRGLPFNAASIKAIKAEKENNLYQFRNVVLELVEFTKHWAILPDWTDSGWVFGGAARQEMNGLIDKYKMLVDDRDRELVIGLACSTIASGLPEPGVKPSRITFEDMLYLPLVLNLPVPKLDMVLTDEIQDFNKCQNLLMGKLAEAGARLITVGDPRQAIYRFRGATGKSFEMLESILSKTERGVDQGFLPINYRSSRAIIRNAQQYVPELQGFKDIEGEVRHDVSFAGMLDWLVENPTKEVCILCRTNDPLFRGALEVIKEFIFRKVKDRKVCILGKKGVGGPLINLIRTVMEDPDGKTRVSRLSNLLDKEGEIKEVGLVRRLEDHLAKQIVLWGKEEKFATELARLRSNIECIQVVCSMVKDDKVDSVIELILDLVTDKPEPNSVLFATVHAAKGLEWETVYVIRPDLSPFPTVKQFDENGEVTEEWEEEMNIMYVRDTRGVLNHYTVMDWIEKERMGGVMDVQSYVTHDIMTEDEDNDISNFWDENREEKAGMALPPMPTPPVVQEPKQAEIQPVTPAVTAPKRPVTPLPTPTRPSPEVVKPKMHRKWVDNGEPF
jgi:superfamily I DNA/RNA helicase